VGTMITARRPPETEAAGVQTDEDFTSSYRSSLGRLVGFFRSKGVPQDEAADLANETMVRMLVHLKRHGRDRTDLGPLVRTIARNLLIERVRKQAPVLVPLGDDIDVADDALEPDDQFLASERRQAVRTAFGSLSPRHRHVVGLWMDGRSPQEIARELGIKRNAVDAILHRARRSLAAKLDGRGVLGVFGLIGFRVRSLTRRVSDAVLSVDPSGQAAPAGLAAFATMGMAAVLTFTAPGSAAGAPRAIGTPDAARPAVTETVRTVEPKTVARAEPAVERVREVARRAYEMEVVRTPVTNPVTGEQDEAFISITGEPTGQERSLIDDVLEPIFMDCAARGRCAEHKR
jgi:RNA polymerase sigma-70 factor, ECF subfamily